MQNRFSYKANFFQAPSKAIKKNFFFCHEERVRYMEKSNMETYITSKAIW